MLHRQSAISIMQGAECNYKGVDKNILRNTFTRISRLGQHAITSRTSNSALWQEFLLKLKRRWVFQKDNNLNLSRWKRKVWISNWQSQSMDLNSTELWCTKAHRQHWAEERL